VDDSKSARIRVVQSLRRYDVDTIEACDGEEAIRLMANQHFSAVFSDMEMPNVNGMELLSTIRGDLREHAPPVVIISSRDETSFRDTAAELGAADYLIKPLADDDLDDSIKSIASLRTLIRSASPAERGQSDKVATGRVT
jgi:CheY-like chemotaxis protein